MKKVNNISNFIVRKSDYNNWESVLKKPRSISIETLNTGRIVCKISGLLNLKNINASEIKDGVVNTPVLAHIIRHEKYGDYLIDTGFDSSFKKEAGGNFKGILKRIYFKNSYIQEKDSEGIDAQLAEKGIKLKGVFITHFHEHIAGAPSLPSDIPFVYGEGEGEINFFPFVYSNFLKNKTDLQKNKFCISSKYAHTRKMC